MTADLFQTMDLCFIYQQHTSTKLSYLFEDLEPGDHYTLDVSDIY